MGSNSVFTKESYIQRSRVVLDLNTRNYPILNLQLIRLDKHVLHLL